ncbi:MAG: RteC domain-containing protein [Bacteroidetes bacterium]|nr:RteC domain-containing protein [Bacteroidota bacterium]
MLKDYCDELYSQLEEELALVDDIGQPAVRRLSLALTTVRKYLDLLRVRIEETGFASVEEEIGFFKLEKPRFYRWLIYYQECFVIDTQVPQEPGEVRTEYYREQLRYLAHFLRQHEFQYQYYRLGATELDRVYFVRGVRAELVLVPALPDVDPVFGTLQDYLFAKFMAYELVQGYLLAKLKDSALLPVDGLKDGTELRWTGDKINLVEVIYALYFTGQLNNGNADLSLIIQFMEQHLQIDLSRAYRDFIDIRNRKVSSPTRFIEQMRESIHKRIDDELAFKPKKSRYNSSS